MFAMLVLSALGAAGDAAAVAKAPPDVRRFIERRADCNHWGGEEAYDAARGREIAAAVRRLRCEQIEADERALKRRFARDPAVLKLLDRTRDADGAV